MKNIRIIVAVIGVLMITNACDPDKIYKEELYQHVISLSSSANNNILQYTHELGSEEFAYIVASCGGTGAVEQDVHISLAVDAEVLETYNWAMYENDKTKYAHLLPLSNYVMDHNHILIPKGEHSGWMSIRIKPNGLSPDTAYFLPLAIESTSAYELNPKKSHLLYRVLIKNQYAEQLTSGYNNYRMDGFINTTPTTIQAKPIQPLAVNKVRMMAGNLGFSASIPILEARAVILEMTGNSVQIKPYKEDGTLAVTQLDDDPLYPNTYQMVYEWDKKYKQFLLHYTFKAGSASEVEVRERLRFEVID